MSDLEALQQKDCIFEYVLLGQRNRFEHMEHIQKLSEHEAAVVRILFVVLCNLSIEAMPLSLQTSAFGLALLTSSRVQKATRSFSIEQKCNEVASQQIAHGVVLHSSFSPIIIHSHASISNLKPTCSQSIPSAIRLQILETFPATTQRWHSNWTSH